MMRWDLIQLEDDMPRAKLFTAGMSCADAASILRCTKGHVSLLISRGELKAQRFVGRILLVDPASVAAYAQNPKRRNRHHEDDKATREPTKKKSAKKPVKKTTKKKAPKKGHD